MNQLGRETRRLFQALGRQWLEPVDHEDAFVESLNGFTTLMEHLRSDRALDPLSIEMYRDLEAVLDLRTQTSASKRSTSSKKDSVKITLPQLHEILYIVQTMEVAWLKARLDEFDGHPLNRGWVSVFHRWSTMPMFRRLWPIIRADFSKEFIDYCESRFSLKVNYSNVTPLWGKTAAEKRYRGILVQEYRLEWPELDASFLDGKDRNVWYIWPRMGIVEMTPRNGSADVEFDSFFDKQQVPIGFITVLPVREQGDNARRSCSTSSPELRFWVRPAYRFLGAGRHLMNQLALSTNSAIKETLGEKALVTQYLERTGQSKGQAVRRRMRLGFLYDYGFRREQPADYDDPHREAGDRYDSTSSNAESEVELRKGRMVSSVLSTTVSAFREAAVTMLPAGTNADSSQG